MKIVLTLTVVVFALFVWFIGTHGTNENSKSVQLSNAQAASQAAALAGQVAAANANTAIYTPLLFSAAANLNAASNLSTTNR